MLLSILICHLTNRKLLLERLMKCLQPQVDQANENGSVVEVLIESDSGQLCTGEKRNRLLGRSCSTWSAAIDDDDLVVPNYLELILGALRSEPDCVSLNGLLFRDGHPTRKFCHSIKNGPEWREEQGGLRRYLRPPNHINTVRTELARSAGFPSKTIGEDRCFSERLFPLLKTEVWVEEVLYHYFA